MLSSRSRSPILLLFTICLFAVSHLFLLFSLSTRHPSASLYPNTNPNLSLDPLPPLRLQSPTIWFVFRNTCRDTDNLTSDGSPVHRLIDQHSVDYWHSVESVRLLKTLETECSRFLGAIKQYLCLSLLKNSSSSLMIQLSCSIFISLVSRFRAGLKAEIGVFFPMIVLRILENVVQPNFQQKIIVLRFVDKLCVDSQILVDIFINYDCDINSSNIFERMVNGLLKTAQGAPPGTATTLLPPQEVTMKLEAMKSLVAILKSMGDWMNKQLHIPDPHSAKKPDAAENIPGPGSLPMANGNGDEAVEGLDSHSETSTEASDVSTIEQQRAYKLEFQEGISLFNRNPKKGIEFLINANKLGNSVEEIAAFLKNTSGLNKTLIGDYIGEREDFSLKVMHAYVECFDFQGLDFDEAIRVFLQGFRLPGEAQKIDRIMEKFAERYCKCNPKVFSSADTAYVLAYSVILLNTDAHKPMVKNKMSADDFIRNNRGIDDGKDLPEQYLRFLFERISKKEIKMKEYDLALQQKQPLNSKRVLGLDSILNIVIRKWSEEKTYRDK
ncbi:SEC7 DOMAIN-CONTAINING PROTEIN-RELATED [Salix koriyanagi]|uniref:SEC7 DOMAIN-CONTAINING PROTEIN-RELATED n=1 Tax=Salix koriyanagi TaxID=2511006 RepID=A0A9Q0UP63_9ROSI|nr:SEC7 DOMAIN-CONTAINING PROTEIN-RELATED [Salix koriyanagi]KAJ6733345.1 SEC7 DOMAIN-CONTAINING PROTEIN-RELATED [Salix koriyanagi]KAJ6733346.1 SEC7 DOMAIN-CONTAINING PROTEIN-RELATED [Salix koriyanagi]